MRILPTVFVILLVIVSALALFGCSSGYDSAICARQRIAHDAFESCMADKRCVITRDDIENDLRTVRMLPSCFTSDTEQDSTP